jgi:hypothetical protein
MYLLDFDTVQLVKQIDSLDHVCPQLVAVTQAVLCGTAASHKPCHHYHHHQWLYSPFKDLGHLTSEVS